MNGCGATFLLWLLVIGVPVPCRAAEFGFVDTLLGNEDSSAQVQEKDRQPLVDGRRTLQQFPRNFGLGFTGVFTRQNLKPFLIGAGVTATAVVFDDMFRSALGDEGSNSAELANDYGGPVALGALTTGLFVAGRYSEDQKFRATTYDMAIAALVNLTYTGALKALVDRDRPNESGSDSFPSGHASNAFALASVAAQHYKGRLRTLAYAGATIIAASRLRADAHWLSDIVGGATLGILVGRGVVWVNNRPIKTDSQSCRSLALSPILGKDTYGINALLTIH